MATYYYTSDYANEYMNWMPTFKGQSVRWEFNIRVPDSYNVACSGENFNTSRSANHPGEVLHQYRLSDTMLPPDKVGWVVGELNHTYRIQNLDRRIAKGAFAIFMDSVAKKNFTENHFFENKVYEAMSHIGRMVEH